MTPNRFVSTVASPKEHERAKAIGRAYEAGRKAERRALVARIRAELAEFGGRHIDDILDEEDAK